MHFCQTTRSLPQTSQLSELSSAGNSAAATRGLWSIPLGSTSLLEIQRQIQRRRRVRERTDGYPVDAGLRDASHCLQVHAT